MNHNEFMYYATCSSCNLRIHDKALVSILYLFSNTKEHFIINNIEVVIYEYATWKAATAKTRPNDTRHVVWVIDKFLFYIFFRLY